MRIVDEFRENMLMWQSLTIRPKPARFITRFRKSGSFADRKGTGRPVMFTDDEITEVTNKVLRLLSKSLAYMN